MAIMPKSPLSPQGYAPSPVAEKVPGVDMDHYERMRAQYVDSLRARPDLPFLGGNVLSQYDRLTRSRNRHHDLAMSDDEYFAKLIETMDAVKDSIQWVMANIKTVEMAYKPEDPRRQMQIEILRNGFMALVHQSDGKLRPGDQL